MRLSVGTVGVAMEVARTLQLSYKVHELSVG